MESITHSFVQKEKDLCNRIEELEKSMEEISHTNIIVCENNVEKVGYFVSLIILENRKIIRMLSFLDFIYVQIYAMWNLLPMVTVLYSSL